jgi:hypothetical protein
MLSVIQASQILTEQSDIHHSPLFKDSHLNGLLHLKSASQLQQSCFTDTNDSLQ